MAQPLAGQVVLVTGGGGAIAAAVLAAFAEAGARVVAADRNREHAEHAVAALGGVGVGADLASREGATALMAEVERTVGPLAAVVHTVGGYAGGPLLEASDADYDRLFESNVRALLQVIRAGVPRLRAHGRGFLGVLASEPALTGRAPGSALYGASKSAAATLVRSLDAELAGTDLAVTLCYPMGAVDTPANRRAMPAADPAHFIDPVELAAALVFAATRGPRGRLPELAVYPRRPA